MGARRGQGVGTSGASGSVPVADGILRYRIRYRRRRTIGLYVLEDGSVEVRAPRACPDRVVEEFVRSRRDWLSRILSRRRLKPGLLPARYVDGAVHPYLGETLVLQIRRSGRTLAYREGSSFVVQHRDPCPVRVRTIVTDWHRRQADTLIGPMIRQWLDVIRPPQPDEVRFRIRRMRRRWGSCSSRGGINLNLWLLRAPGECVEYVVVHELCHLREFNHGPRFHALLDRFLPDWRQRSDSLDAHQRRFGVAPIELPAEGVE